MRLKRVDWFRVFIDLDRRGFSLPEVGRTIGVSRDTLQSIRAYGVEPSYWLGAEIMSVWCMVLGKNVEEAPMTDRVLSAAKVKA